MMIPLPRFALLSVLIVLVAGAEALAQSRPAPSSGPMTEASPANLPGARIGPYDLIALSVYDAPEFTRTLRVDAQGTVLLPLLKTKIKAGGLLPSELEALIAEVLEREGILVDPVVLVTLAESHSRPVAVVGAVKKPVTFQATGRVTLLDALARAEGLSQDAAPVLILSRRRSGGSADEPRESIQIAVRDLIDEAKPELNYVLEGGEEIRVPEAKRVFVVGNVKKPGAFAVRDGSPVTVLKALALAEGLGPFPEKVAYIYRPQMSGKASGVALAAGREEIPVEIDRLIRRKTADVELQPDDVLYIPENRGRRNVASILEKTASFGMSTASGVLVWRR